MAFDNPGIFVIEVGKMLAAAFGIVFGSTAFQVEGNEMRTPEALNSIHPLMIGDETCFQAEG